MTLSKITHNLGRAVEDRLSIQLTPIVVEVWFILWLETLIVGEPIINSQSDD